MKAILQDRYGSFELLVLREIDQPAIGHDEVLVRVRATSVHPDVWHVVAGRPYVLRLMGAGFWRPRYPVPGTDLAGIVEDVGRDVTRFRPGDEVFGESVRGYQWVNGGAYAEYAAAPEEGLAHKPGNVTFEQAAAVSTAGVIAIHNLRSAGEIEPGQRVLVNGAGGGVGSIALQLAKAAGAVVTGVDHADKSELLRALGADHVIDYTREDFTRGQQRYDLIFDIPGNHPFSACRRALAPNGKYVLIGHDHFGAVGRSVLGSIPRMFKLVALSTVMHQLPDADFAAPNKQDSLAVLRAALEGGQLTPIIDKVFPLDQVVDAMRYLVEGRPRGRVIITP